METAYQIASLATNAIDVMFKAPEFSKWELASYIVLAVPTIYAMLAGAPFVPTQMKQVRRMVKAAKIKPGMVVYDLGCGDGRLVHLASREYGAKAIGYELSPFVWLLAVIVSPFWRSKAKIKYGDFWGRDISDADVIFCYLLPQAMKNFQKKIIPQLKKGSLIVSHAFEIPNLKATTSLPRIREEKLGPVWVYKI